MMSYKKHWIQSIISFYIQSINFSNADTPNTFFFLITRVYQNAQKVSYEHRNRLASPIDTAVWWIEHTLATGGYELGKSHTNDMYWFTYYSVDAIIVISLPILLIIWITVKLLKCCCASKKSKTVDKMKKIK